MNKLAKNNFDKYITQNPYPGRGLIVGKNEVGEFILVYWIMGRSPNSRNRVLVADANNVKTKAADESKLEDPSLIIYNVMLEHENQFILSNGDQTDTIYNALKNGGGFNNALLTRNHEPDAPNFTPRISAILSLKDKPTLNLSSIRVSDFDTNASVHSTYQYSAFKEGFGYFISTYLNDGNPLPSFDLKPQILPLNGNINNIANTYYHALDKDNKISVVVKKIDPKTLISQIIILNKYQEI